MLRLFPYVSLLILCIGLLMVQTHSLPIGPASVAHALTQAESGIVMPVAETDPVRGTGDSADDIAIWIHPSDPALSTIIGTDKGNGIFVYDLSGRTIQFLSVGGTNNIDVRYNVPVGGQLVDIVTATNTRYNTIAIYSINPVTRQLQNIAAQAINPGIKVYGLCMYHSPFTGKYYTFITKHYQDTSTDKSVQQWELQVTADGLIDAVKVREFSLGYGPEGCVADDVFGRLYMATSSGIWEYGAEPTDGTTRTAVAVPTTGGVIQGELEGITLYYSSLTAGYLIVSDQTTSNYHVYRREGAHEYMTTFTIQDGDGIDGVTDTDGVDVINANLGPAFPLGLFVAQDNPNMVGNTTTMDRTNFKLVPWPSIAAAASQPLTIDTTWNPREPGTAITPTLPTPSPTPTQTPTSSPTPSPTPTRTATPSPTSTTSPTYIPSPTPTYKPTASPTDASSPTPTRPATPSPTASHAPLPAPSPTGEPPLHPDTSEFRVWLPLINQ